MRQIAWSLAGPFLCLLGVAAGGGPLAWAETKTQVVLDHLDHPTAVAIQPETGAVFVAESGAGRIVRAAGDKPQAVVTGVKVGEYQLTETFSAGPLSLAFFDKETLLVGQGGATADEIRAFAVPAPGKSVNFDDAKFKLGPVAAAEGAPAEGNYYGLAVSKFALFASGGKDPARGWIVRSEINGTKFGELKRFVANTGREETTIPGGLVLSPRGEVVVGQFPANGATRSRVSFYNANNGKLLLGLDTDLGKITGLAYGPKTGLLYALAFPNPGAATSGGLYRLDAASDGESQKLAPTNIVELARPTALAFGAEGTLFITLLGERGAATGQLVKIAPGL